METILQLIMDSRAGEAVPLIESEFGGSMPKYSQFKVDDPAVAEQDRKEGGKRQKGFVLSNLYLFSLYLMEEKQLWDEAIMPLDLNIQLSQKMHNEYFVQDCYFRKAVCCKKLGRRAEMVQAKQMVSNPGKYFVAGELWRVEDLD
jgi:hypothetical protein